jgi:hypothetical protein
MNLARIYDTTYSTVAKWMRNHGVKPHRAAAAAPAKRRAKAKQEGATA